MVNCRLVHNEFDTAISVLVQIFEKEDFAELQWFTVWLQNKNKMTGTL